MMFTSWWTGRAYCTIVATGELQLPAPPNPRVAGNFTFDEIMISRNLGTPLDAFVGMPPVQTLQLSATGCAAESGFERCMEQADDARVRLANALVRRSAASLALSGEVANPSSGVQTADAKGTRTALQQRASRMTPSVRARCRRVVSENFSQIWLLLVGWEFIRMRN